jgi:hypothetical protein
MVDVSVTNHGSLVGLTMHTEEAQEWANQHLPADAPSMGNTIFAEPRYVEDIVDGMRNDGLEVE